MPAIRINFTSTGRADRPIVLTHHEVDRLRKAAGRDVLAELLALSSQPTPVKTLGQLMRELTAKLTSHATSLPQTCQSPRLRLANTSSLGPGLIDSISS